MIGVCLLCGSLGLTGYNIWQERVSGEASDEVLDVLSEQILQAGENGSSIYLDGGVARVHSVDEVNGLNYIGVLTMPTLGLQLPVAEEWSYDNLKIAPCRLSGTAYGDDLVVAAHNYSTHFGRIHDMNIGDAVDFTDVEGETIHYELVVKEQVSPYAVEDVTSGQWDLTLVTCTIGGRSRVVARCDRIEE